MAGIVARNAARTSDQHDYIDIWTRNLIKTWGKNRGKLVASVEVTDRIARARVGGNGRGPVRANVVGAQRISARAPKHVVAQGMSCVQTLRGLPVTRRRMSRSRRSSKLDMSSALVRPSASHASRMRLCR